MQLLVSVTSATEASAALAGGADLIDAKDPTAGALGAVSLEQFRRIADVVAGARLVTAALGDAADETATERAARAFATAGAAVVKIGFAGISSPDRVASLLAAAVHLPETCSVVAVAYADADRAASISPHALVNAALRAGAGGVLLDTFDKTGGGLRELIGPRALRAWADAAHEAGLIVALAGKLAASDLAFVRDAGADIAGVRGAACEGGRTGRVAADRVRMLRAACDGELPHAVICGKGRTV
jgi:(5-formylfuran-3-yl)methyl phosphate synthase